MNHATVGLDRREREQVAQQREGRRVSPSWTLRTLSTNASSTSRSTCALTAATTRGPWTRENTSPGFMSPVDAALEPPGDPRQHVLLAGTGASRCCSRVEEPGLLVPVVAARQQVADPLRQLVHRGLLDDRLDGEVGDEPDHVPSWSGSSNSLA